MTDSLNDATPAGTLADDDATPVGLFRADLATGRWWWSDETFRIHGFEPGEVVPTTTIVLAHKHPEDRDLVRDLLETASRTGAPFASVHRIVDANGDDHAVSLVGRGVHDDDGAVAALEGYVLDLTTGVKRIAAVQADASIHAAARSRRSIEQAKAVIALAFGIDDDAAFEVLRRRSNVTNVPVRVLSREVVEHAHDVATHDQGVSSVVHRLTDQEPPARPDPEAPAG